MNPIKCSVTLCASLAAVAFAASAQERQRAEIGNEISIPRHLQDGEEFEIPISRLIQFGESLFTAKFTIQEGAGRPLLSSPTVTQTLSIEGYQVRQNLLTYSSAGVSLTSQGPTQ